MTRYFVLVISILISNGIWAQEEEYEDVSVNRQFWGDFNSRTGFNETMDLSMQVGYRTINPHIFDRFVIVPTLNIDHKNSPKFLNLKKPLINSFHLGSAIFYTNNYDGSGSNLEFRLVQGFGLYYKPKKFIPLKTYFRLEERFQKNSQAKYWDFSMRMRLRFSTVIEWNKHLFSFNQGMYIPISVEFFFNMSEANLYNDKIRISPGIGYKLNDDWKFELYGSYHYSNNTSENQDASNDFVLRLRVYKSDLRSKRKNKIESKEDDIKELIE